MRRPDSETGQPACQECFTWDFFVILMIVALNFFGFGFGFFVLLGLGDAEGVAVVAGADAVGDEDGVPLAAGFSPEPHPVISSSVAAAAATGMVRGDVHMKPAF